MVRLWDMPLQAAIWGKQSACTQCLSCRLGGLVLAYKGTPPVGYSQSRISV